MDPDPNTGSSLIFDSKHDQDPGKLYGSCRSGSATLVGASPILKMIKILTKNYKIIHSHIFKMPLVKVRDSFFSNGNRFADDLPVPIMMGAGAELTDENKIELFQK